MKSTSLIYKTLYYRVLEVEIYNGNYDTIIHMLLNNKSNHYLIMDIHHNRTKRKLKYIFLVCLVYVF